jgi:TolB-like protein/DNA-binding winged helix-turn-helix (wHTH) protein/Tfp pilus assembly protein PilF
VKLQPQPFKVLALLVDRAGDLVQRDELKRALWGNETYVDFERGLNFCILQVRTALGDSPDNPKFIQTVPRRGYRFVAPVERVHTPADPDREGDAHGSSGADTNSPSIPRWRLFAVAAAAIVGLVAGATFVAQRAKPQPGAGRTMLAVLPFEDLTGDTPPAYFADGLTEEVITQLGRVSPRRLGVIARTSAMSYRGSTKSVAQIGRELGVSHVLEGSVRREGDHLRVSAQLVTVPDQAQVWSETYDRTVHGALNLQSELAARVTRALAVELLPAPWAAPGWTATTNADARDAYLRGKYFANRGLSGDIATALHHFERAAELDPKFAQAFAAQADAYHVMAISGQMLSTEAYGRAAVAAREAVRLDPNSPDGHAALGLVQLWADWQPLAAAQSFERALALNPSDATAHHDYAWALVALQRFDEAVTHITRARELDPISGRASNDAGWLYLQIRQPSEAVRACRQTLTIDPDSLEAQQCLERAYLQRGEYGEALAAARTALERGRGPVPTVFEQNGPPQERLQSLWRWRLDRLQEAASRRYVNPYTMAMHQIMLGDREQALQSLEQAYATHVSTMVLLPTDPIFDALRADARFQRLVGQIRGSNL